MSKKNKTALTIIETSSKETSLSQSDKKITQKFNSFFAILFSIIFWSYLIIKIFLFDFDVFLIEKYLPKYSWILNIKFFIAIGIISIILFFIKQKKLWLYLIYVIFFPFILIFIFFILILKTKNWIIFITIINSLISSIKFLKINFITNSFALISILLIILNTNTVSLYLSIIYLFLFLFFKYFRLIYDSFRPAEIFSIQPKIISKVRKSNFAISIIAPDKEIKNIDYELLTTEQKQKFVNSLQMAVAFNKICYFIADKLKQYKKSKILVFSNILYYLKLFLISTFIFSFINLALYKINHDNFIVTNVPNFFIFLFYSFRSLTMGDIIQIQPHSNISILINMISTFTGIVLLPLVLVNILITIRNSKFNLELDRTIKKIKNEGEELSNFIKTEYKLTTEEALQRLEQLKSGLIQFIYLISTKIPKN